jgi:hypothetical protein
VAYVCANSNGAINKWTRNKPIRVDTPEELTDEQRKAAQYGIYADPASVVALTPSEIAYRYSEWEYLPPRNNVDYARLSDFENYNDLDTAPISSRGDITFTATSLSYTFDFGINKITINGVTLADFYQLADYYPCVVVFGTDGTVKFKTATAKFSEAAGSSAASLTNADAAVTVTRDEVFTKSSELLEDDSLVFPTYLMCGCSVKVEEFATVLPTNGNFICLPSDEALTGSFIDKSATTSTSDVTIKLLAIAGGTAVSGLLVYDLPSKHSGFVGTDGTISNPLSTNQTGSITLLFSIKATSTTKVNLGKITATLTNNLVGATTPATAGTSAGQSSTVSTNSGYRGTFTKITSMAQFTATVGTTYIAVAYPSLAMKDGSGLINTTATQDPASVGVSAKYGTSTIGAFNVGITY